MRRLSVLAAIGWLAMGTAVGLAGPPVQYQAFSDDHVVEGVAVTWVESVLSPAGEVAAIVETEPDRFGIVVGTPGDWTFARAPVSEADASAPEAWSIRSQNFSRVYFSGVDRIVFEAWNRAGTRLFSVRELVRVNGEWAEQEIVRVNWWSDSWRGWAVNSAGSIAWGIVPLGETATRFMVDRGLGPELLAEMDVGPDWLSLYVDELFDDETMVLTRHDHFSYDIIRFDPFTGASARLCENYEADYAFYCYVEANNTGEVLVSGEPQEFLGYLPLDWAPAGITKTPAFSLNVQNTPFEWAGSIPNVSDSGRVMFSAGEAGQEYGVFIGPNPATDLLVRNNDVVLGLVVRGSAPDLNARDEFVLRATRTLEIDGQPTEAESPLLGTICPADVNRDGVFDNGDIIGFITEYLDGSMSTDFNNDGLLDNGDIGEFITQFLAGC